MRIRIIGQANDSGIGTHYYYYTQAMKQIAAVNQTIELIDFNDIEHINRARIESQPNDVNVSLVGSNLTGNFQGYNVNWAVFESTRIPSRLINLYKSHNLWIPSEWGRKIAIQNGVNPEQITVVPEGVDNNLFNPYLRPKNPKFRFLIVAKYEIRKSIDEALTAFAQEFGNNPGVELIIKSDFFRNPELKYKELTDKIENLSVDNIKLIWGNQKPNELINLYRSADVFVFPTKAEGWGLPLIEAAATGLPLITTFYSAQTEFLQDIRTSCVFVPYELVPNNSREYQSFFPEEDGNYGVWADVKINDIALAMRTAYRDFDRLSRQAVKNSDIIRSKWSWANSAIKSLETLKKQGFL